MDPNDLIAFGKRIEQIRTERGYSRESIAGILDVPVSMVEKWENGVKLPEIDHAYKLSLIYRVTVEELVGGTIGKVKPKVNK